MTQLFTEHLFGGSEVFLLPVMAYDLYVAICKPLHYLVIMRQRVCFALLVVSCVGGFLYSVIQLYTVYGLPFCGPNVIDHFLCDMQPLLKLVCTDTFVSGTLVVANGILICAIVFLLLPIFYGLSLHSEESESGREAESPPDLWFPHHCCLLLCSLITAVCFFVPLAELSH